MGGVLPKVRTTSGCLNEDGHDQRTGPQNEYVVFGVSLRQAANFTSAIAAVQRRW